MNSETKSILLFIFGCIPTRAFITYLAKQASTEWIKLMGYLALLPAIGFLIIFITGTRKTGAETFGQPIWWNSLRPIHSLLYFLFAYHAINGCTNDSWKYLAADLIIGTIAFLLFHFSKYFKIYTIQ